MVNTVHSYLLFSVQFSLAVTTNPVPDTNLSKFNFKVNDIISGECLPVPDPDMEPVDFYKVSKIKLISPETLGVTVLGHFRDVTKMDLRRCSNISGKDTHYFLLEYLWMTNIFRKF